MASEIVPVKFKIVVIGDSGVGKSTYINYILNSRFIESYFSTDGVEIKSIKFLTNYGQIICEVWDVSGLAIYRSLCKEYFTDTDGFIAMASIDSQLSMLNLNRWLQVASKFIGKPTPFVGVINKIDQACRESLESELKRLPPHALASLSKVVKTIKPFYISVKNKSNLYVSFQLLLSELTGRSDLKIIEVLH